MDKNLLNKWKVSCTKIIKRFVRLYQMKIFLCIDETTSASERTFETTTKLQRELLTYKDKETTLLMELSPLAEDNHVKIRGDQKSKCENFKELVKPCSLYKVHC